MQKLGFPSIKNLDHFKSLSRSGFGTAKTFSFSSRPSSDSVSLGSFANLKLTAEKLVKEQASVKTDLELANCKLKKSMEHIRVLEEKLQNAFNENAKLKVKQKEDEKLWKGLESKFSSTKTLCDQLTETLHHLASQIQNAEKDTEFFEVKVSESSKAIDSLNEHMEGLSLKLSSAEETIRNRGKEIEELKFEKEENDRLYKDERCKIANLIEEKDALIKKFEATIAANKLAAESLNSKMGEVQLELRSKDDEIKCLLTTQENLEKENSNLLLGNNECAKKLSISLQEIKHLEGFVAVLASQLVELDKQNLTFTDKFDELNSLYNTCFKLVQQEKDLAAEHAQKKYEQLHDKFLCITSERDALELVNQKLNSKIIELQKAQESVMAQLSEECHLAERRIQKLESEAENLVSKKIETENLVSKLEKKIDTLSETLEMENKDNTEKMQAEILGKKEEIDILEKEREKHEAQVMVEEKEQLILQYKEREKKLEVQISENQAILATAESKLVEARKQYDVMLESKQIELSRHLKEISQRNDQAINDIRRKYDMEKQEIVKLEKEKVDKVVGEMEQKCDQKVAECREELRQQLLRIQEENATLVTCLQQENDRKEQILKADHHEELKRAQLQAEDELRKKTTALRNEHEVQMKALRCQFEDECKKLQEELNLQKSKEDRQRALLQLQWKVMSDKPKEEQEVNSRRYWNLIVQGVIARLCNYHLYQNISVNNDYSISSVKKKDSGFEKRTQHALVRPEEEEKESPFPGVTQTPVSKLLKKVENTNTRSVRSIPKHHKKVTHHEYEVETSNGRTITKRRKTRSTVLFEDPRKHKKVRTPKANTPASFVKGTKGCQPNASNIGDLFSEGSLNPYADDPIDVSDVDT
ncbi:hypothetical protein GOBAR_AA40411 [Gossypium barbadense]|uniref:Synaptonemal complex protein 1 n=1 Tax=Gossypium barbadense TaxID=3634 RepID=A0A2P5VN87_GOSBA|nr:hypothetical protein GOBAR_AA40411 [Gossypium barbadense]